VDLSVDYIGLGPSLSTDDLHRVLPTTPRFTRSAGVKLGPAGLLTGLHQAVDDSRDHPPESAARTPGTLRSLAARHAGLVTGKDAAMSVSGTGVSSPVMSSLLKRGRKTSVDHIDADDPLIQKVCARVYSGAVSVVHKNQ